MHVCFLCTHVVLCVDLAEADAPTPSTSNHKTSLMRSPSLRTQTSISSTMSSLFRRATRRAAEKRAPKDDDNMSTVSHSHISKASVAMHGPPSPRVPSQLSRQPSMSSIATANSRNIPHDLRSITSKRSGRSQAGFSDANSTSRGFSRSLRSADPPPSSFHPKIPGAAWLSDDDRLTTAADIRAEIQLVEAEERRLLDAFNGLEITATTRHRQAGSETLPLRSGDRLDPDEFRGRGSLSSSAYANVSQTTSRQINLANPSRSPSYSPGVSRPLQLKLASSSSEYLVGGLDIRDSPRSGRTALRQSPRTANQTLDIEMDDIRRRRADIVMKYQERLAFLRARLKGAEMHERLLRK